MRYHTLGELARQQARCEQEALAYVDAQTQQEVALGFIFNAFGHHAKAQTLGDTGHGLADSHIRRLARYALEEAVAELQCMDRQAAQVIECAVAFTEIVDGQLHTELA